MALRRWHVRWRCRARHWPTGCIGPARARLAFALGRAVPIALGALAIGSLENRPSLSRFLPLFDKLGAVVLIVMGLYMLNANFFLIPGLAG